ncbi:hypothetical protein [Curtobacterium ammoniigenes]|uniref:hypothetical protein n=1 Tax=Curtobacterium ammoniigenes TaxID=395387 RepID=UPI0008341456|nr:hypothetical protein [Curtobacterium ammoniigenes]
MPDTTAAPLGLLLFLLATVVSVASAIAAALLAGLVLARQSGRIPGQQPTIRISLALPLWLIAAAAFSFLGERILSIIAAVSN